MSKAENKNHISYERRKVPLLRHLYHIRFDPNDKTLQFKTPFTGGEWKNDPYFAISEACAKYNLTDEKLKPFLEHFKADDEVQWEDLRSKIKASTGCEEKETQRLVALYAFLHSPIHAPALSAVNAINNFYLLTPYDQWKTATGPKLLETPKGVLIQRSREHFTAGDGKKCLEQWDHNGKQHRFCEGKDGPKKGNKPWCRVAPVEPCACKKEWKDDDDNKRKGCDPETAKDDDAPTDENGNKTPWCMIDEYSDGCIEPVFERVKAACKAFKTEGMPLLVKRYNKEYKKNVSFDVGSNLFEYTEIIKKYKNHYEFYTKYIKIMKKIQKLSKESPKYKEEMTKHVKSMETIANEFNDAQEDAKNEGQEITTFRINDVPNWRPCTPKSSTEAECHRCDFLPNTHFDLKGQSKQNRLNDQNKMLEMYRKRVVKSINLFVGQKAYVINRLEHMVKDDVDITGVIESTNIKDGQFRPTVGNTTENKLRRNDVYYMLDYYFQKEYRKLYPDDSENGSDTTTSEDDDDMSTGNKYQIIGGKHTLPILWEFTFHKQRNHKGKEVEISKAYFSQTDFDSDPDCEFFDSDMIEKLKDKVRTKLKKQWNEDAVLIDSWPQLYKAWEWHSKSGVLRQGGREKVVEVCGSPNDCASSRDTCITHGTGCFPKTVGVHVVYEDDTSTRKYVVQMGEYTCQDDSLPSLDETFEHIYNHINIHCWKDNDTPETYRKRLRGKTYGRHHCERH